MMRKAAAVPKGARKARKSAALIIAETNLAHLTKRVDDLYSLVWKVGGSIIGLLIIAISALVAPFFTRGH